MCAVLQKGVSTSEVDTLTMAHVGDSRGVLCRAGFAVALTEDHKSSRGWQEWGRTRYVARGWSFQSLDRPRGSRVLPPYVLTYVTPTSATQARLAAREGAYRGDGRLR